MFFSNLEIILKIKLENFIISFFDTSFNLIYIYIYIIIIFIHHYLKNLMNNFTSYLMSMLCKSSTNKYMIMVKNVIDKIMKNMIKLIKKKKLFITQILNRFFPPVFFSLKSHLFTIFFFWVCFSWFSKISTRRNIGPKNSIEPKR